MHRDCHSQVDMRIKLRVLNGCEPEVAASELMRCCGARNWVDEIVSRRPYSTVDELFASADEIWYKLCADDWREAFSHHPKIGDLDSLKRKYADTGNWAEGEQKGVQSAGEEVLVELARLNDEYEKKFGYIFIVCATGKSAGEMLDILKDRITNNPEKEIGIAAEEQRKITRLRLGKLLT